MTHKRLLSSLVDAPTSASLASELGAGSSSHRGCRPVPPMVTLLLGSHASCPSLSVPLLVPSCFRAAHPRAVLSPEPLTAASPLSGPKVLLPVHLLKRASTFNSWLSSHVSPCMGSQASPQWRSSSWLPGIQPTRHCRHRAQPSPLKL